ncbi:MAG: DMT family transporter [Paludibacter sp.]|jgi:drug/metabolite transporter (DMT)-like permease|nr:DMT family transporter [Paludibacter sp.]
MWLFLGLLSALLLGAYDVSKKISVERNAVIPVLLVSVAFSSAILLPFVLLSRFAPQTLENTAFFVPSVDFRTHLLLVLKAVIVLTSWIFGYFGLKHLPITIASPVKATQPVWVVVGGLLIFDEKLNGFQWIGVGITLISFFMFSFAGKKETQNDSQSGKWIWFVIMATLTGAVSGLFDKYLIHNYNHMSVQCYYTFYQAIIMAVITAFLWYPTRQRTTPFRLRWAILLISVFLVAADFAYFYALTMDGALISVVSTFRRAGVIVPFIYGALVMHDKNMKLKIIDMIGVIIGMFFLFLGSK